MGKKQKQASLVEDLEQEIEDLKLVAEEANQRAQRLAIDNEAFRCRESAAMRREHAEQQRKRKEAERAAARERVEHIAAGRLPLEGAESVSVTHEGDEVFIDVQVKLTKPEAQAVQDYLGKRGDAEAVRRIAEQVNKIAAYYAGPYGLAPYPRRMGKSFAHSQAFAFDSRI